MLPDTYAEPSRLDESAVSVLIPESVFSDLIGPKAAVGNCDGEMFGASVPEAAVQEDRNLGLGKHEVCSAWDGRERAC